MDVFDKFTMPLTSSSPATPEELTASVLGSLNECQDPRLRRILRSLVGHLHGFIAETQLTEDEWRAGIEFLTMAGQICDEHRQEFILLSDVLGASTLVDAIEHTAPQGATESTVLGPFYVPGSPLRAYGESIALKPAGPPVWVYGVVRGLDGTPLAGAEVDVWQNGDDMLYAVQDHDAPPGHLRGRFITRADGTYAFTAVRPTPYPIPHDGPVGRMLAAAGRHPWRPAHIHMIVRAPAHRSLTTHIFDAQSEYLGSDTVFGVKPSLLRRFERAVPDDPDRPANVAVEVSMKADLVLEPGKDRPIEDRGRTA
jgi:catechol 1,2-dioxygenase